MRDANNKTPLHVSCQVGAAAAAAALLENGAPIGLIDDNLMTPLHTAAQNGHEDASRVLLQHGAAVDGLVEREVQCEKVQELIRPLPEAAAAAIVDLNMWTPLHHACGHGNEALVKLLLDAGADVNTEDCLQLESVELYFRNICLGCSPLHLAVKYGNLGVVQLLLERGAMVGATNRWKKTPLHTSYEYGETAISKLLMSQGADPNAVDNSGCTPLNYALGLNGLQAEGS